MTKGLSLKISRTAMFTALIFVLTMLSVPIPWSGGYVHSGDAFIFIACFFSGWYAVPAAIIGSALADLVLAPVYIPATVVIKGLMAVITILIIGTKQQAKTLRLLIAFVAASLFMQSAYTAYDLIMILAGFSAASEGFVLTVFIFAFLFGLIQSAVSIPLGFLGCKKIPKAIFLDNSGMRKTAIPDEKTKIIR